ncbi:type I-E CRISPR-associated protein Cse2/CasB [Alteromonas sp. KS69]|jgi:CRISPR system Cascade subunit CasB|uniref:type I-E CRISPR-associated protein Cse2/CasB n=1 Tax=Alteromonas sp. KS69 TaxID=2109917 RepID=UPI000F87D2A0|nr:type I-E CRISPR-associated protein Cse2/CasB [Alteromonas sp. KS69]RUP82359.1 type I-E CRISPR-associated protein Cse2/CasB [Alteromonas sp. KS69]|tara:strand:+ start:19903 stop:20466 length:564 start_codon:yes stop_codon:yes gene_type:complete
MEHKIETLILRWWQSMFLSTEQLKEKGIMPAPSSHKAQLRRADSLDAVMLTAGFRALWLSLPDELTTIAKPEKMEIFAAIAAALVQVKNNSADKLATVAGKKSEGDKSVVSELRFSQLQNAKTTDDFIRRLRRILQQVKGKVSVTKLAKDIEGWFLEFYDTRPNQASKRISVQWAMDYYRAASNKIK